MVVAPIPDEPSAHKVDGKKKQATGVGGSHPRTGGEIRSPYAFTSYPPRYPPYHSVFLLLRYRAIRLLRRECSMGGTLISSYERQNYKAWAGNSYRYGCSAHKLLAYVNPDT